MKKLAKHLLFTGLIMFNAVASAGMDTLYTEQGYPYKDLVQRSDKVKLIYTENNTGVVCHVEVEINDTTLKSDRLHAEHVHFDEQPLASCLTRDKAINFLAQTFMGK